MNDRSRQNRRLILGAILAILCLIVGTQLGLMLSKAIGPLGGTDDIAHLAAEQKEEYIVLVAAAYRLDGDLDRARAQLDLLESPRVDQWISDLVDRRLAAGQDDAETRALVELAYAMGVDSRQVVAYVASLTPPATATPSPTPVPTATPTPVPTDTPVPPTEVAPTETPQPTDTPFPPTEAAPTETPQPTDTPRPQPTSPPRPQATATPAPTATPSIKWNYSAQLVGPGEDAQTCNDGLKLIRVTVLDAAGKQIPGVWVYERYTNQYRVTGHKGDDPFWGPGEAEFSALDGGQLCIAMGDGGPCETDFTRSLPCHDMPPFEDLWAAGYCERCDPGITKEECQQLVEEGKFLGVGHYAWRVVFQRTY